MLPLRSPFSHQSANQTITLERSLALTLSRKHSSKRILTCTHSHLDLATGNGLGSTQMTILIYHGRAFPYSDTFSTGMCPHLVALILLMSVNFLMRVQLMMVNSFRPMLLVTNKQLNMERPLRILRDSTSQILATRATCSKEITSI